MNITQDFIPYGRPNRPALKNPMKYITIHETDNTDRGANAKAHASYLKGTRDKVSWHYTVDSSGVFQHLPDNESAYHAGDGKDGPGNAQSIGIELCVNADGNFNSTMNNAVLLVRELMLKHNISANNIVQHNRWNGKDCPRMIRHKNMWDSFVKLCKGNPEPPKTDPRHEPSTWAKSAWNKAKSLGITDGLRPHDTCTREELVTMLDRAGVLTK